MQTKKYNPNDPEDIYARGSIIIKILVIFFIILLIFNNCSRNKMLILVFLVATGHLAKLIFVHGKWKEKKREINGLDGPKLYVKINRILCGPNWYKQDCWPRLFVPTIRIWLLVLVSIYTFFYRSGKYIKIALGFLIIYCMFSVYPENVNIDLLKCNVYGGNYIFMLFITLFILLEMKQTFIKN